MVEVKAGEGRWWAVQDLNLSPLACEASALTTELTAPNLSILTPKIGFVNFKSQQPSATCGKSKSSAFICIISA